MSDNWSLKDKTSHVISYEDGVDDWFYKKEDIETLRQKLMEDFKEQVCSYQCEEHPYSHSLELIELIINRRFGMEENHEDSH